MWSGNTVRFHFLGSKINADGNHSCENKRCLLLGSIAMTNLDSVLKSRDMTLPTKVWIVKATVYPVVMYGYESWTTKETEHWRIDALDLWCWRRLLRIPWTTRRSNQSILKEINPEYSPNIAEAPILRPPDEKNRLFGKDPDSGKDWRQEEKGTTENEMVGWHHSLNGHEFEQTQGNTLLTFTGLLWRLQLSKHTKYIINFILNITPLIPV